MKRDGIVVLHRAGVEVIDHQALRALACEQRH
jgi:hypothetical protein